MSRPVVLHVLEASNHGTGTARHLIDLVRHSGGVRHHVALPPASTSRGEPVTDVTARLLREGGATVHELPMRRQVVHPHTVRARGRLARLVEEVRPDVLHGHSGVGGAVARMVDGPPAVYTPNGIHPSMSVQRVERLLARRTGAVIAVSPSEADVLVDRLGYDSRRVHVVPNGIAAVDGHESSDPLVPLSVPDGATVVGWIGRHARQKAPDVVIRAAALVAARCPDVHVVMAGGGPELERSRRMIQRLGVQDRVHLLGFVAGARRLLGQIDVLMLPSRWEGAPYVPLEAMAARVPVVLSDCVGNADLVEPGVTGWRVPIDDPVALCRAVVEAVGDPERARRFADAAHARFQEDYVASRMAERTEAVYESVLASVH